MNTGNRHDGSSSAPFFSELRTSFRKWLLDLSFGRKLGYVLLFPVVAQILVAIFAFKTQLTQQEASYQALHSKEIIGKAEKLFRNVLLSLNSTRSFMLTGDIEFQHLLLRTQIEAFEQTAKLQRDVKDNPSQAARLLEISSLVEQILMTLNGLVERRMTLSPEGTAGAPRTLSLEQMLGQLRDRIEEFLTEQQRLERDREAEFARSWRRGVWVVGLGSAFSIVFALLLALSFNRNVSSRVASLMSFIHAAPTSRAQYHFAMEGKDEISVLSRAFEEMARKLGERAEENEAFVYSVSHDMRSPLVNLDGFSRELEESLAELGKTTLGSDAPESLKKTFSDKYEHDLLRSLQFIRAAVGRLSTIINALLRLSRAGQVVYSSDNVPLGDIIHKIIAASQSSLNIKGATFEAGPLPTVLGDPVALEQIFANLIHNSLNYLSPDRPGSIKVYVEPDEPTPGVATIVVEDNGLGFPESFKDKIFLPFQRYHPDVAEGNGMGLAIVQRLVRRMNGRIWVSSIDGQGTKFYVSIPVPPEPTGK